MKTRKIIALLFFAVVVASGSIVPAADLEGVTGQMISVTPDPGRIDVKVEVSGLFGPMGKDVTFNLSPDVKWYICLGGSCVEKRGIEGANMIMEYTPYEPYGLRVEGCDISMTKSGDAIIEVWFEIC